MDGVIIEISVRKRCSDVPMKKIEAGEDRFYDEIEGLLKTKPELRMMTQHLLGGLSDF